MTCTSRGWCTPRSCAAPWPGAGSSDLDVSEARRAPGVIAVLTAAEINPRAHQSGGPAGADQTPRRVLADGDVRYVGEPIAMVVAESRYLAEDAAELVSVDIEPEDPVVDRGRRRWPRAARGCTRSCRTTCPAWSRPRTCPSWTGCWRTRRTCSPRRSTQHRYVCVPMETRGLVAEWDPVGQAARGGHRRPGRARAPVVLLPDAGHPRGRHPGDHGRCRRLVRAEGVPHSGRIRPSWWPR